MEYLAHPVEGGVWYNCIRFAAGVGATSGAANAGGSSVEEPTTAEARQALAAATGYSELECSELAPLGEPKGPESSAAGARVPGLAIPQAAWTANGGRSAGGDHADQQPNGVGQLDDHQATGLSWSRRTSRRIKNGARQLERIAADLSWAVAQPPPIAAAQQRQLRSRTVHTL